MPFLPLINLDLEPFVAPPQPAPPAPGSRVAYVDNWRARLFSRLYEQFKDKPNITALAQDVAAPQFQELEDAAQALLSLMDIAASVGVQLDVLGFYVGQLRAGVDDATYRLYLKARIKANLSSGTVEEIYAVYRAMLGVAVIMRITQRFPAALELAIATPLTAAQAEVARQFLTASKLAGVRAYLIWQPFPDSETFTFAQACMLTAPASPLDVSIAVDDASSFPFSGSITIDPGLASEETVAFTRAINTSLLTASLSNPHAVGAAVELVGDAGLGFGDSSNPATGGAFTGTAYA